MQPVDREGLAAGVVWLVRGIAIISISLPLALADDPWSRFAPVFGPLGAVAVAIGAWRVTRATAATPWGRALLALAAASVPLRVLTEVGVVTGAVGTRFGAQVSDTVDAVAAAGAGPWDVVALVTIAATFLGVIALARHLNVVLTGVAADQWRQVLFAWTAAAVVIPASVWVGWVELLLLAAATLLTAGAFLLLSLLATYRAAEDDELEKDFERRG